MPGNAGFLYASESNESVILNLRPCARPCGPRYIYHIHLRATDIVLVGYMAAGWAGSEGHAPGFPKDGSWVVRHEGMLKAL